MKGGTNVNTDKPIIFFDGVCNLCVSSVQYVLKNDSKDLFLFASLQSKTAGTILNDGENDALKSVVLYKNGRIYTKSTAALHIAKDLKGLHKLLFAFIIVPKLIRDVIYDVIANNRYKWFGKKDECMVPTPEIKQRFLD